MIIWKGWGILSIVIPFICALLMQLGLNNIHGEGYYSSVNWAIPVAILIAAIPVFLIGNFLNKRPGKILIDPETNEQVELKNTHSFFWIPMEYFAGILVVIAAIVYFK